MRDELAFQESLVELKGSQKEVNRVYSMIKHVDKQRLQKAKKLHKEVRVHGLPRGPRGCFFSGVCATAVFCNRSRWCARPP